MRKPKHRLKPQVITILLVCILLLTAWVSYPKLQIIYIQNKRIETLSSVELPEWIIQDHIKIHDAARTGNRLKKLNNIVVHYVGNPGTTAIQNRNFFNNDGTDVSSHFVIGLEGEVIQCLPLYEVSAASNHRNIDTISVEVCHPDETGRYNDQTYNSLINLLVWLCRKLEMSEEDVIRHYDVTGKLCPIYYVNNPDEWELILNKVNDGLTNNDNKS